MAQEFEGSPEQALAEQAGFIINEGVLRLDDSWVDGFIGPDTRAEQMADPDNADRSQTGLALDVLRSKITDSEGILAPVDHRLLRIIYTNAVFYEAPFSLTPAEQEDHVTNFTEARQTDPDLYQDFDKTRYLNDMQRFTQLAHQTD